MSRPLGRPDPHSAHDAVRGARVEPSSTQPTPAGFPDGTRKDIHIQSAKGVSITTRCSTVDEFVATFGRYVENSAMFIPNARRSLGTITQFAFNLATGKPVLTGQGAVVESFETNDNRFRRAGILVELQQLGKGSAKVFERLVASREKPKLPAAIADAVTNGIPVPVYAQAVTMPVAIETPISPRTLTIPPASKPGLRAHTMIGLPIISRAPAPAEIKAPAPVAAIPAPIVAKVSAPAPVPPAVEPKAPARMPAKTSTKTAFKVPAVIGPPIKKPDAKTPVIAKPAAVKPAAVPEPVAQEYSNDFIAPNDTVRDALPLVAQAQRLGLAIDDDVPYETTSDDDDLSFDMSAAEALSSDSVALARGSVVAMETDAPADDLGLSAGSLVAVALDAMPLDAKALAAAPPAGPLARGSLDAMSYEAAAIARSSALQIDPAAADDWSDAGWDNEPSTDVRTPDEASDNAWTNDVPTFVPTADEPMALDAPADDDLAIAVSTDDAPSYSAAVSDDAMSSDVRSLDAIAVEPCAVEVDAAVTVTPPRRLLRWTARAVMVAMLFATSAVATVIIRERIETSTAANPERVPAHDGANVAAAIATAARLDKLDVTRTGIAPDLGDVEPPKPVAPAAIATTPKGPKAAKPKAKKPATRPASKKPAKQACSGLDCL